KYFIGMTYQEDHSVTATATPSPAPNTHHRIEEWLNSATHGLGAILSIIGTAALIIGASQFGDIWKIVSFSIFGASLILLYLASALYHSARRPDPFSEVRRKRYRIWALVLGEITC
ncbi:hemolysin III family protein, partial [Pantoea sp. SIMBA_133]